LRKSSLDTKARLWDKLLAQPDELTDLRVIFAEYNNVKGELDEANYKSYRVLAPVLPFNTFEERQAYLKMVADAQQWRAHVAALKETYDSLCKQLRMMADDLNPEDLEDFLRELEGGNNAPAIIPEDPIRSSSKPSC
jgi:predicted RNA-binding Zn ribbon-like protein